MSVLNGTISGRQNEIDSIVKEAADNERAGRKVSEALLKNLENTRKELRIAENLLVLRKQEAEDIRAKYNQQIVDFLEGQALMARKYPKGQNK